ncbi:hypothetical protein A7982_13765 [Minicystis rosea]|nr:hypothetical protein A7982_13765 [Minicystis rosea]
MLHARHAGWVALGLVLAACADVKVVDRPIAASPRDSIVAGDVESVVLVTIDGVRWQEIFNGADPALADRASLPAGEARSARSLTPNLHRPFFDEGAVIGDPRKGEPFTASGPRYVSLPAYVELMTGAASGCRNNDCEPALPWALADEIAGHAPKEGAAVFSSWERIARALPARSGSLVQSTGRAPDEQAPAYPGHGEYRPDRRTAALAIDHLVHNRPRFMWVALGDTDEWAHRNDYRGYVDALHFADAFVGELCAHLAEMGERGARTTVFVTTDHGRDAGFADHGGADSANVWLMAHGGRIAKRGSTALGRERHLADVAPTISAIMREPVRHCRGCGEVLDELL